MANPNPTTQPLPSTGFVRLDEVLRIFPVGRSTWWQGIKDGRYPKGIKLSPRTTAWKVEDIRNLIETVEQAEG